MINKNNKYQVLYADSVTNNTSVWVKINSKISCINIESLFNKKHSLLYPRKLKGDKEYTNLPFDIQALSVNKKGVCEFKNVKNIMRHKTDKDIYLVKTSMGEIEVTKDHSLYTTKMKTVKPTERPFSVISTNVLPEVNTLTKINLYEYISHRFLKTRGNRCFVIDGVSIPRVVYVGTKEYDAFIKIIGAYLGDGTSSNTKNKVSLHIDNNNIPWLNKIAEAKSILTGTNAIVNTANRNYTGTVTKRVHFDNILFYSLITNLCGHNSKDKHLPEFFFNLPDNDKQIMFEQYYFGDGSKKSQGHDADIKNRQHISFDSSSYNLMSGFIFHLNNSFYTLLDRNLNNHKVYSFRLGFGKEKHYYTNSFADCIDTEVKSIEKIDYNGYVYDLTVEDNHNFVTGLGIVAHNTDGVYLGLSAKDGENNKQQIIDKIKELELKWQKELNYDDFKLDIEESNFMFPVAHKNYLFGNLDKIKIHGNNFSAKNKSKLSENIMKKVVYDSLKDIGDWSLSSKELIRSKVKSNILENTQKEVSKINMDEVDLEQLILYENVNPVSSYKKDTSIYALRTIAIEKLIGEKITHSTKLPMLVGINPLPNIPTDKISKKKVKAIHYMYPIEYIKNKDIDFEYYKNNIVAYINGAFALKKTKSKKKVKTLSPGQLGLDKWM